MPSRSVTQHNLRFPMLQKHLQEGEVVLWQGIPSAKAYLWPKLLRDIPLMLIAIPVVAWLESMRYHSALVFGSTAYWAIAGLSLAAMLYYDYRETSLQILSTHYALTNKRILIHYLVTLRTQEKSDKVEAFSLSSLRPKLRQQRGNLGTITFGLAPWNYSLAFRGITEASGVFEMLEDACRLLPDPMPSGPYYAKTQVIAQSETPLKNQLRRSEQILWQGQPNPSVYAERELRLSVPSVVVLVALFGGLELAIHHLFTLTHFGLLVMGITGLIWPLLVWAHKREAATRHYFVTNQRVIIGVGAQMNALKLEDMELSQTKNKRLIPGRNDIGTLVFEKRSRFIWHGQGGTVETVEFSFKWIDYAAEVAALIDSTPTTNIAPRPS